MADPQRSLRGADRYGEALFVVNLRAAAQPRLGFCAAEART